MVECVYPDNTSTLMSQWTDIMTVSNINMDTMELTHKLRSLPTTWPSLFNLCHFLLAALAVRKEVGFSFSRLHPLATWLATITAAFAGSLIANPLLGEKHNITKGHSRKLAYFW